MNKIKLIFLQIINYWVVWGLLGGKNTEMRAKLKINGKEIVIEDVKKVSWLGKYSGLMFRKNSSALLFEFSNPCRKGIHSFFCNPFIAVWLDNGKIIEYKIISEWKARIIPEKDFDMLIEIPLNEKYGHLAEYFS